MKSWYQSKLIWTGIIQVLSAAVIALSTALTSGLDLKSSLIAGGTALLGALVIAFRSVTDTEIMSATDVKEKKAALSKIACLGIFFAALGTTACGGALDQFADKYSDDIKDLEKCSTQCGVDIVTDSLSCPISGGNIEDLVNAEVAKGMAESAGVCILNCLVGKAIDVGVDICK